ncbi:hypothetical protein THIOM_000578 [Candidatus Thiomargarita nelsonii]|uniref:Uncharacterized protein n=1 Tax=Candidatus Thiomargarita nelsonii TaxID=1003181 RepID=A0A176S6R3_9GAMM|nr:hypothetical protein THIOM_000578 [Candidatus Thiomargarita nelsonii]
MKKILSETSFFATRDQILILTLDKKIPDNPHQNRLSALLGSNVRGGLKLYNLLIFNIYLAADFLKAFINLFPIGAFLKLPSLIG